MRVIETNTVANGSAVSAGITVTFTSNTGQSLTVLLDSVSPVLTDGFGGWEAVDRPRRTQMTRFKGRNPFRQDIAVLFDGFSDSISQEEAIEVLVQMSQQPSTLADPPIIFVSGTALRTNLNWIIENISWDNQRTMWDIVGGFPVRVRQAAVVHLLEYVDDTIINTPANPAVQTGQNTGKILTVPDGLTVKQIAVIEYHDANQYYRILEANPWMSADPRKIVPKGTPVFIPDKNGFTRHTFIVP